MKDNKVKILVLTVFLVGVLLVGRLVWIDNQRDGQSGGDLEVELELRGVDTALGVGEEKDYEVVLKSGEELVSGLNMILEVDGRLVGIKEMKVNEEVFETVFKNEIEGGGSRVVVSMVSMGPTGELPKGEMVVGTLKLEGRDGGKSYVILLPGTGVARADLSGEDKNELNVNLVDKEIEIQ